MLALDMVFIMLCLAFIDITFYFMPKKSNFFKICKNSNIFINRNIIIRIIILFYLFIEYWRYYCIKWLIFCKNIYESTFLIFTILYGNYIKFNLHLIPRRTSKSRLTWLKIFDNPINWIYLSICNHKIYSLSNRTLNNNIFNTMADSICSKSTRLIKFINFFICNIFIPTLYIRSIFNSSACISRKSIPI